LFVHLYVFATLKQNHFMTEVQTEPFTAPAAPLGIFGTNIPSSVILGIAFLLFFLPFIDIKCNTLSLQTVSGFKLATGFKITKNDSKNALFDNNADIKTTTHSEKEDPNKFAMIAFILGVVSFALSFFKTKQAITTGIITSVLSAVALIGLYIDIKRDSRIKTGSSSGDDVTGFEKLGQQMAEGIKISVDFTPWFYVAVIAFLIGAFFCYKRIKQQ
jgi:hypothetical protein